MMWSVYRMVEGGVCDDNLDDFSELDQAVNQSILRKLAQPHKPNINPNFEIWTLLNNLEVILNNFENFDNFVSFYNRAFS